MPAYNAERYIEEAVCSIIEQTYTDWELIVVDDGSKDKTIEIIEKYKKKNSRIRLIKREQNSGGCRLPRFDAILAAKGDFVCPIDSDDTIEPKYLEKLIKRQKETSSDIVLGRMVVCDENQKPKGRTIPIKDYPILTIYSGEEACKRTIGEWELGMNGLLARSELYKKYINEAYQSTYNGAFADEIDHRRLLLCAKTIAMTDASYFYRQQPQSIIHSTSPQSYNSLLANKELLEFVAKNFNEETILQKAYNEYFSNIYRAQQKLFLHYDKYTKEEKRNIQTLIKEHYLCMQKNNMTLHISKKTLLSSSFLIFKLYTKATIILSRFIIK